MNVFHLSTEGARQVLLVTQKVMYSTSQLPRNDRTVWEGLGFGTLCDCNLVNS